MSHIPVLLNEAIQVLDPKPGEFFIDGTFGSGGHSRAIQEKIGATGKLLAIDWDETNFKRFAIGDLRFASYAGNYADLPEILKKRGLPKADGLIIDLGFSSEQLSGGRGFSFGKDEPLLMTYSRDMKPVKEILKEVSEEELAKIIKDLSDERFANRIAKEIKEYLKRKPIETSKELAEIIKSAVPKNYERGHRHGGASRIHPATRTFMALRIYANQELENLEKLLKNLELILKPGGRAAIISFHSLEDRLVKNHFRQMAKVGKLKMIFYQAVFQRMERN